MLVDPAWPGARLGSPKPLRAGVPSAAGRGAWGPSVAPFGRASDTQRSITRYMHRHLPTIRHWVGTRLGRGRGRRVPGGETSAATLGPDKPGDLLL